MSYKIIDYTGETVEDDFYSATAAYKFMSDLFTKEHIKNMGLKVIREENKQWPMNPHHLRK